MEIFVLVMTLYGQPKGTPVATAHFQSVEACEAGAVRATRAFRVQGYMGKLVYTCAKKRLPTPAELRAQS